MKGGLGLAEMDPELRKLRMPPGQPSRSISASARQSGPAMWSRNGRAQRFTHSGANQRRPLKRPNDRSSISSPSTCRSSRLICAAARKTRALHLRMLRHAIERGPDDLQMILNEVLDLPQRKQKELATLLQETTLSAIITAAKTVADRLKFIAALESIVFDPETKGRLKERSQLHRIWPRTAGSSAKSTISGSATRT